MGAPVGYTCPLIDQVVEAVSKAEDFVDSLLIIVDDNNLHSLSTMLASARLTMESIRSANSDLRDWGEGLERDLKDLQDEINFLEEKVDELSSD